MSIVIENLSFTYMKGTPYEKKALDGVSLKVEDGEFVGIIGHTGCGKSTLIQHINGLIKVQEGSMTVEGIDLTAKKPDYKSLRSKVGLVFQYPEYQLFAETVFDDVAFGPKNMGVTAENLVECVKDALNKVGLDYNKYKDKSPFDLSGGQKRRVALAGVLAMKPKVLVLDEPTAGLDPAGKKEILALIKDLHVSRGLTVVMISHNMDEIADIADRIAVMKEGRILACLPPEELFAENDYGVEDILPPSVKIAKLLRERGIDFGYLPVRKSVLAEEILKRVRGGSADAERC